jgi:serpin B
MSRSGEKSTEITLDQKIRNNEKEKQLFGLFVFEKVLSTEDPNINIMISPLSVSQAISMTLNGANDNNLTQMKEVLVSMGIAQ